MSEHGEVVNPQNSHNVGGLVRKGVTLVAFGAASLGALTGQANAQEQENADPTGLPGVDYDVACDVPIMGDTPGAVDILNLYNTTAEDVEVNVIGRNAEGSELIGPVHMGANTEGAINTHGAIVVPDGYLDLILAARGETKELNNPCYDEPPEVEPSPPAPTPIVPVNPSPTAPNPKPSETPGLTVSDPALEAKPKGSIALKKTSPQVKTKAVNGPKTYSNLELPRTGSDDDVVPTVLLGGGLLGLGGFMLHSIRRSNRMYQARYGVPRKFQFRKQ